MSENKEMEQNVDREENANVRKEAVTNEMLLEHLKEIEVAQGCITNGINTLFNIVYKMRDRLDLDEMERRILKSGMIALKLCTEQLSEVSELDKRVKEKERDVNVVETVSGEEFIDFLKKILK